MLLRATLGPAYVAGRAHTDGQSVPGRPDRPLSLSPFGGPAVAADVALGYAFVDGLAVAVEAGAIFAPSFVSAVGFRGAAVDGLLLTFVGGVLIWHPRPRGPVYVEAAAAFATATFSGFCDDVAYADGLRLDIDQFAKQTGVLARTGVGYAWRVGHVDYGLTIRALRGRLSRQTSVTDLTGSELALSATWF